MLSINEALRMNFPYNFKQLSLPGLSIFHTLSLFEGLIEIQLDFEIRLLMHDGEHPLDLLIASR